MKNTHFSNGFCTFQVAIRGAKRVHTGIIGEPKRHMFHDFGLVPLSKSCFPPRAGNIFSKNRMIFCKKRCSKHGRHKENSRSYTKLTKLLQRCIHSFLLTGPLGAKNARDCSQKQYFDAGMARTNRDRNGQKSEKSKSGYKKCSS